MIVTHFHFPYLAPGVGNLNTNLLLYFYTGVRLATATNNN